MGSYSGYFCPLVKSDLDGCSFYFTTEEEAFLAFTREGFSGMFYASSFLFQRGGEQ